MLGRKSSIRWQLISRQARTSTRTNAALLIKVPITHVYLYSTLFLKQWKCKLFFFYKIFVQITRWSTSKSQSVDFLGFGSFFVDDCLIRVRVHHFLELLRHCLDLGSRMVVGSKFVISKDEFPYQRPLRLSKRKDFWFFLGSICNASSELHLWESDRVGV